MSGRMRKRESGKATLGSFGAAKSFHKPQKDNSVRQKKKFKLNNYDEQKKKED